MRAKKHVGKLALRNTLAYSAVFNASLSFYQLCTLLLSRSALKHAPAQQLLRELLEAETVSFNKARYFLKGIPPRDWFLHEAYSKKALASLEDVTMLLKKISWIKLLAVTGSVAAFNSNEHDDVDVLIVTAENRLWLTRFLVVLILKLLGKYRTDRTPYGKLCPNIFLSEDHLCWAKSNQNMYVAQEIIKMYPIFSRDDMYFRFLKANSWVFTYFGNFRMTFPAEFAPVSNNSSWVLDVLEKIILFLQVLYMQKRKTTEVVTKKLIHFNREDSTANILRRYQNITAKSQL